jgi:hypothetical protein
MRKKEREREREGEKERWRGEEIEREWKASPITSQAAAASVWRDRSRWRGSPHPSDISIGFIESLIPFSQDASDTHVKKKVLK